MNKMTIAEQILKFNQQLSHLSFDLPDGYKVINPFNGEQKDLVNKVTTAFYQKYYNDNRGRRLILGSTPARRGSAITRLFLMKINKKYNFFDTIISLEHPRYIMQYNSKRKDIYVEKYMNALRSNNECIS